MPARMTVLDHQESVYEWAKRQQKKLPEWGPVWRVFAVVPVEWMTKPVAHSYHQLGDVEGRRIFLLGWHDHLGLPAAQLTLDMGLRQAQRA